jgi:penicillin-binding protein 1A
LRLRLREDEFSAASKGAHWLVTGPVLVLIAGFLVLVYYSLEMQDLRTLRAAPGQPRITLLDDRGAPFARLGGGPSSYLTIDEISPWLPDAVVAIEDHRFYDHAGLDLVGIARAMWRNLMAGRIVEGGSTISQQLAKLTFLTPERSFWRKLKEAFYALWIEARFDKPQILEAYLNQVYLGGGAYGAEAAAQRYFGKPARLLTLAESAMLAGLIKAPSHYAPTRALATAQERAGLVLERMVEAGFVSPAEASAAQAAPATLVVAASQDEAGYFTDWVASESRLLSAGGWAELTVQTTLDAKLQRLAADTIHQVLAEHGFEQGVGQAALVAMTPDGKVRAMVGGRSYAESQFNRATQARRQPGSAFKLFLYLAALEAGARPDDRITAAPIAIDGWQPRNFDDRYPRSITIADSFAGSVNTAAVRLAEQIGREQVVAMARRLGITAPLHSHPSLTLGTGEVSLLELTAAYATVANHGRLVWPDGVVSISAGGRLRYQHQAGAEPVLALPVVEAMTGILRHALVDGTGWRAALPGFVVGKTGTSSGHRDAWFIGFTRELVVGVWVGNDDGRPTREASGGGLPARIFRALIEQLPPAAAPPVAALPAPRAAEPGGLAAWFSPIRRIAGQ